MTGRARPTMDDNGNGDFPPFPNGIPASRAPADRSRAHEETTTQESRRSGKRQSEA